MTRHLTPAQLDRACGVLIASAAGDALGAGYEFTHPAADLVPQMIGGGLGNFAPGEWTDDTSQAVAIARVAATGIDLRTPEALTQVAQGFADWYAGGPADVGIQTSAVLSRAGRTPSGADMAEAARQVHERTGRSAGNGSLMRTGPVALAYLDDPEGLVEAALAVSALTHHQALAGEVCAVWCLMIRHAVLTGELPAFDDIAPWVPNADHWRDVLAEAESRDPGTFATNGWAQGALQAAWSAISHTPVPGDGQPACNHLVDALGTAIRIGHDTDTVAAIAGALLGARWGMTAVPARWRRILHGWPGLRGIDLEHLACLTVRGGQAGAYGWPLADRIDYSDHRGVDTVVTHPGDDGVLLAGAAVLDDLPASVDAVVSLCLTGRTQVPAGVEQVTYRLLDEADPAKNSHLDFVLADAAQLVADLRDEGRTVLLHCVATHSRTPAVAIAYAMQRGVGLEEATRRVLAALPEADPNRGFRASLGRLSAGGLDTPPSFLG